LQSYNIFLYYCTNPLAIEPENRQVILQGVQEGSACTDINGFFNMLSGLNDAPDIKSCNAIQAFAEAPITLSAPYPPVHYTATFKENSDADKPSVYTCEWAASSEWIDYYLTTKIPFAGMTATFGALGIPVFGKSDGDDINYNRCFPLLNTTNHSITYNSNNMLNQVQSQVQQTLQSSTVDIIGFSQIPSAFTNTYFTAIINGLSDLSTYNITYNWSVNTSGITSGAINIPANLTTKQIKLTNRSVGNVDGNISILLTVTLTKNGISRTFNTTKSVQFITTSLPMLYFEIQESMPINTNTSSATINLTNITVDTQIDSTAKENSSYNIDTTPIVITNGNATINFINITNDVFSEIKLSTVDPRDGSISTVIYINKQ
jgi:hypothetical protein